MCALYIYQINLFCCLFPQRLCMCGVMLQALASKLAIRLTEASPRLCFLKIFTKKNRTRAMFSSKEALCDVISGALLPPKTTKKSE